MWGDAPTPTPTPNIMAYAIPNLSASNEAVGSSVANECGSAFIAAKLKRTGWWGVVNIVYGGEKPAAPT